MTVTPNDSVTCFLCIQKFKTYGQEHQEEERRQYQRFTLNNDALGCRSKVFQANWFVT